MTTTDHTAGVRSRVTPWAALGVGYGAVSYLAFVAVFGYAVGFVGDLVVPRTVDRGGPEAAALVAAAIDAAVLGLFAVQHSLMARPGFKRRWARVVPRHVERSTYVLLTSVVLALAFWQWRPIPTVVWNVQQPTMRTAVQVLYVAGWAWVLAMTFAIDHLDLLGLRQVARRLRGLGEHSASFALPLPYRLVRHPMMIGFFVAFLAAPTMTVGHLLFAGLGCGYILVGVRLEERDLTAALPQYAGYAATTPRFLPRLRRSAPVTREVP